MGRFQGGILEFLWRYELSHAQRSVFVAVLFLFLTHLAVNAWVGSGARCLNDTFIWTETEAVRSACQEWLVNPWGSSELRNFVAAWEDLVADAVGFIVFHEPEISTSMPYWLDWYAEEHPEFRALRHVEFRLSVKKCRFANTLLVPLPAAAEPVDAVRLEDSPSPRSPTTRLSPSQSRGGLLHVPSPDPLVGRLPEFVSVSLSPVNNLAPASPAIPCAGVGPGAFRQPDEEQGPPHLPLWGGFPTPPIDGGLPSTDELLPASVTFEWNELMAVMVAHYYDPAGEGHDPTMEVEALLN